MQILKEEEEDAKPMARCEERRKEWAKHWQCGMEVENQKNKPWKIGTEEVAGGVGKASSK